jgi:hypothetical protein
MRAREFIFEGMTFSPAIEREYIDDSGEKRKLMTGEPWWTKSDEQCWVCDGTGLDPYTDKDIACGYCHGKKTYTKHGSTAPELDVSNSNGMEIQRMLGVDPDYSGTIYHKDLPKVMRKLIMLKNQGIEQHIQAPSVEQGKPTHWKDEHGISHIIAGPKMHDAGRTSEQVMRYVDKLIELVQFAQKNNAHISWG